MTIDWTGTRLTLGTATITARNSAVIVSFLDRDGDAAEMTLGSFLMAAEFCRQRALRVI